MYLIQTSYNCPHIHSGVGAYYVGGVTGVIWGILLGMIIYDDYY